MWGGAAMACARARRAAVRAAAGNRAVCRQCGSDGDVTAATADDSDVTVRRPATAKSEKQPVTQGGGAAAGITATSLGARR